MYKIPVVYSTMEEGEWQMLFPGPRFGERDSAWQGKYHKKEERINITGIDRNVEGKRLKSLTVGGSRCASVKLCRKFNNASSDLVTTEQQA